LIISTRKGDLFGAFIFPKMVLYQQKIFSDKNKDGKRGIRVYPPWDLARSKQAQKTQEWQTNDFVNLSTNPVQTNLIENLTKLFQ